MAAREADIALRMKRLPEGGPLVGRRVAKLAFSVYASTKLVESATLTSWHELQVIGLPDNDRLSTQAAWLDRTAALHGAAIHLRLADVNLRHRAAREGVGAALLPCFLGDEDPDLVRLTAPPAELVEDLYMLLHDQARTQKAVTALAGSLIELFTEASDVLQGTTARLAEKEVHGGPPRTAPHPRQPAWTTAHAAMLKSTK